MGSTESIADYRVSEHYRVNTLREQPDPMVPSPHLTQMANLNQLPTVKLNDSVRSRSLPRWALIVLILAAALLVALLVLIAVLYYPRNAVIGFLASLLPLAIVMSVLLVMNRWVPQPLWLLLLAFLWGAGIATSVSLAGNTGFTLLVAKSFGTLVNPEIFSATLIAPFVEETLKGLGVLLILIARRSRLNSPLEGIVIAGILAEGFAFTENIIYFARSPESLLGTFFARALLSPFAHTIFTSLTGVAIVLAITRMNDKHRFAVLWAAPIGWGSAVCLHALWNTMSFSTLGFVFGYALIAFPIFLFWLVMNLVVSAQQRNWIASGLRPYVKAGWFAESEVPMVTDPRIRRQARSLARRDGKTKAMRAFQNIAAEISLNYVTARYIGLSEDRSNYIQGLLSQLGETRNQLAAPRRL